MGRYLQVQGRFSPQFAVREVSVKALGENIIHIAMRKKIVGCSLFKADQPGHMPRLRLTTSCGSRLALWRHPGACVPMEIYQIMVVPELFYKTNVLSYFVSQKVMKLSSRYFR